MKIIKAKNKNTGEVREFKGIDIDNYNIKEIVNSINYLLFNSEWEVIEDINYVQVGETIKCGHCDLQFQDGQKEADKLGFKCQCKCHNSKQTIEEKIILEEQILENIEPLKQIAEGNRDIELWNSDLNNLLAYIDNFVKQKLQEHRKQVLEEVIKKIEKFMVDEFGYKGKYIEPDTTKKSHGTCCYCSGCGYFHDDCVCESNRIYDLLQTLIK